MCHFGPTSILKTLFIVGALAGGSGGMAWAQSIEQAQGELRQGYGELYERSKASPRATPQKMNEMRDTATGQRKVQFGKVIAGQVRKVMAAKKGASPSAESPASSGSTGGGSSSRVKPTRSAEPETRLGADGIPAVIEFKKKKSP